MGLFRSCEDYFLYSEEVPAPFGYQPLERGLLSVLSLSSLVSLEVQLPFLSTLGDLGLRLVLDVLLLLVQDNVLSLDLGGVRPDDAGRMEKLTDVDDLLLILEPATLELFQASTDVCTIKG